MSHPVMAVVRGVATRFCNGGAASSYTIVYVVLQWLALHGGFSVSVAAYVHSKHNIELIGYHTSP